MQIVNVTHDFELHLMAVRCNSIIARPRKYVKFRLGIVGCFLPKGATRFISSAILPQLRHALARDLKIER